jgi:hypothetical protein
MAEAMTRAEIESKIVGRAWKDETFRREFVTDPKGTIEKYTGAKLPAELKILVHEEDASTLHFRIPQAPGQLSELSDGDLEKVAGGLVAGPMTVTGPVTLTVTVPVTLPGPNLPVKPGW